MKTRSRKRKAASHFHLTPTTKKATALRLKSYKNRKPNLLAIRTKRKPTKSAILIKETVVEEKNRPAFTSLFTKKLEQISCHRPIHSIIFDENGSPTKIITPEKKTELYRTGKLGDADFFSDDVLDAKKLERKPLADLTKRDTFLSSAAYTAIKKPTTSTKVQSIKITPALLKTTAREIKKNNNRRSCSQAQVMVKKGVNSKKGSATQYAKATKDFPKELKWEWLHLIAHRFLGKKAQNENNLVCGINFANTDMMFAEAEINYLMTKYPEGIQLDIECELIANTQIAKVIKYTITTRDFTLNLVFNTQNPVKPVITHQDYMHALFSSLSEMQTQQPSSPPSSTSQFKIFKPAKRKLFTTLTKTPDKTPLRV